MTSSLPSSSTTTKAAGIVVSPMAPPPPVLVLVAVADNIIMFGFVNFMREPETRERSRRSRHRAGFALDRPLLLNGALLSFNDASVCVPFCMPSKK